jgi:tetratricopeptide (TPR) repeat protein
MELQKKSELSVGRASFVISTELAGDSEPSIETRVVGSDGSLVFKTSQDVSELKPIFQNSQKIFARLEAQHHAVVKELEEGRIGGAPEEAARTGSPSLSDRESDALARAVDLLGSRSFEKAIGALRAVLETYPNCSEARELLEVAYKASSGPRLAVDMVAALKRGTEAFADGRARDAIEAWKQCLIEEPSNRRVQLLVLLTTTWSPSRRREYASEVLAPGSRLLSAGRPEEVQALLLATQTAEGVSAQHADETAVSDETLVQPQELEDLVPDAVESVSPLSALDEPDEEDQTLVTEPPFPEMEPFREMKDVPPPAPGVAAPAPVVAPPAPVVTTPPPAVAPQARPVATPPPAVTTPAPAAATAAPPAPVPRPAETPKPPKAESRPEVRSSPTVPRVGGPRKPQPRAQRGIPWGLVGAAAVVVLVLAAAAFWLLSGSNSVSAAELERAASLVSSGQYPQAIAAYDGILGEFGDSAEVYLGRGRAKLASGDAASGLADLERAQALDPQSTAIAEELADVLYSQGSYPRAIEFYEKAFAGGAGTTEGRYRAAVALVREGRADDALTHLAAAIAKDPQHGEAQFLYGQLLNARGRYEEAEKSLRSAEKNVEAGGDYLNQLAIALLEQGKLEEAEEVALEFTRGYPSDARARSVLGEIYLSRKQYEPARAQLIQALRTDPNEPRAQIALGRTWLAIGKSRNDAQDLAKAKQVLAAARGVDEGRRLLALGQVALAERKLDEAGTLLQQARERGAPELPVHLSLAETRSRSNDLAGAAEELQRASALAPGDPAVSLSLAITYFQLKDTTRAADQFLKAIQGIGLVEPPGEGSGPIVFPEPHVPLPDRFNVNRAIKDSAQAILKDLPEDPTASQLKTLSESTTFLVGGAS